MRPALSPLPAGPAPSPGSCMCARACLQAELAAAREELASLRSSTEALVEAKDAEVLTLVRRLLLLQVGRARVCACACARARLGVRLGVD